nr:heat shock 70 kDa protein 12A-like isoform X2 [Crassostrea gigas]
MADGPVQGKCSKEKVPLESINFGSDYLVSEDDSAKGSDFLASGNDNDQNVETECLEHTVDLVHKLQQATTKLNDQEEEIKTLQTKLSTAKQESDQLMDKKENELKAKLWDLKEELQHAYFKTKEQEEEIRNLQNTMSESKQSFDQVVRENKIELQAMETKCLNVIEELQQTNSKVKDQEEKIENLQTKLLEAKEEIEQLVYDRKIVIQDYMVVAAIDIGTTFSGYAFAMIDEIKKGVLKPYTPNWGGSGEMRVSNKTQTCVLLDKDEKLVYFGFDAENAYNELSENGEEEDYFYFRRFTTIIYDQILTFDTEIADIRGRKMQAIKVFIHAIRYLKDHLLKFMRTLTSITNDEILWVLTVPVVWENTSILFMRIAAQEAGIPSHQMIIALEPEAAYICCKHLPVEELKGTNTVSAFQSGSRYLVLDAGGLRVDITIFEVKRNGRLEIIEKASHGDLGGSTVNRTFKSALEEIVTKEMIEGYCHEFTEDYIELFKEFEKRKRDCRKGNGSDSYISLKFPVSFTEKCYETFDTDIITLVNKSRFRDKMYWKKDKIAIHRPMFETFFQPACDEIVRHVKKLLQLSTVKDVEMILMVGGFSDSDIFQDVIRRAFPNCQVLSPKDAGLAVLCGAVLFGYSSIVPDDVNTSND